MASSRPSSSRSYSLLSLNPEPVLTASTRKRLTSSLRRTLGMKKNVNYYEIKLADVTQEIEKDKARLLDPLWEEDKAGLLETLEENIALKKKYINEIYHLTRNGEQGTSNKFDDFERNLPPRGGKRRKTRKQKKMKRKTRRMRRK